MESRRGECGYNDYNDHKGMMRFHIYHKQRSTQTQNKTWDRNSGRLKISLFERDGRYKCK